VVAEAAVIAIGGREVTAEIHRNPFVADVHYMRYFCLQVVGCCWRFLVSVLTHAGQAVKTFKPGRLAEGTSQSSEGHDNYDAVYA
jgi:hypothetical protein